MKTENKIDTICKKPHTVKPLSVHMWKHKTVRYTWNWECLSTLNNSKNNMLKIKP